MPKNKPRYLRLAVKYDAPGVSPRKVLNALLLSIQNGDYDYPHNWRVAIGWTNKPGGELKWGEWTKEMTTSAQSSEGFDIAVAEYLENQL